MHSLYCTVSQPASEGLSHSTGQRVNGDDLRLAESQKYRHKSEISDEEIRLFALSEYAVAVREMISEFVFFEFLGDERWNNEDI